MREHRLCQRHVPRPRDRVHRRLPVLGEHGVRIGAVLEQPDRAVGRAAPVENRVQRARSVGRPGLVDAGAVRQQGVEHGDIAGARGQRQRDAVVGVGAGVEQRRHERQDFNHPRRSPQHRPAHVVMQPGKPGVRIHALGDEASGDRRESSGALGGAVRHRRVADVVNRLPAARSTGFGGERRILVESRRDARGVAEHQRGVEIRRGDPRMQSENPLGPVAAPVGGRFEELLERGIKFEGDRFHVVAQLVPGGKAVLAGELRLRFVQTESLVSLQFFRLPLELVEIGAGRELLGCHRTSMLNASGPQAGQHGDSRAVSCREGWTQSFARTRGRPWRMKERWRPWAFAVKQRRM